MAFGRRVGTLMVKNLRIILLRNPGPTSFTALMMPIALAVFLSLTRRLAAPPSVFGIGTPTPVLSLGAAFTTSGSTGTVVLVNSGHAGGAIDRVIDTIANQVTAVGNKVTRLNDADALRDVCRSSHRGVTDCFGAVVFNASPDEGVGDIWNYTIRADSALGHVIKTDRHDNSVEVYVLPLQRSVDAAIAGLHLADGQSALPSTTDEYPFTSLTQDELDDQTRRTFESSVVNYLAVSFITIFIGACYHVTSFITLERETGMTELLEAMMPSTHHWEAQAARFLSYHIAFTLVYFPGWVIASVILGRGLFPSSNIGVILVYFLLCGMSFVSLSILAATFFKKSQLSNVSLIAYAILGIIAQTIHSPSTAAVAVLSVLFVPCNFVFFTTWVARWEQQSRPLNLAAAAPESSWTLAGIVLWAFIIIQIIVYPLIGALIERTIHGTTARGRTNVFRGDGVPNSDHGPAVQIDNLTKIYKPSLISRLFGGVSHSHESVLAVDKLTLVAERGQILALLGANGSGKSTILDSITGINTPTSGNITIDITGGVGITPQKDVLWDDLTVFEHVEILNYLKTPGKAAPSQAETEALVRSVDLGHKMKALSKTLSGGQKRKLQLGMMLSGGSAVCCVDEVSSSLDPVSRRKVWDILLAERGRRTIIMTTHFLDEAEVLADRIVVLSGGRLRAEGSAPELKNRLGAGYKIHVPRAGPHDNPPEIPSVYRETTDDGWRYTAKTSADAAKVILALERDGFSDYTYSDPTLESVFLQLAEEVKQETEALGTKLTTSSSTAPKNGLAQQDSDSEDLRSLSARRVGHAKQIWILFLKRCTILKRDWLPYLAAFGLPIVAAGVTSLLVKGQNPGTCASVAAGGSQGSSSLYATLSQNTSLVSLVAGPSSRFTSSELSRLFSPLFGDQVNATSVLSQNIHVVDSINDFNTFVASNRRNITPAGWWLGDGSSRPTFAYLADQGGLTTSIIGQNALDIMLSNISIATSYVPFDSPQVPSPGNSLQLVLYMCLALSISTAFFGLYPNLERRQQIRALEYSNGVLPLALWTAHIAFDFAIIVVSSAVVTVIFVAMSSIWYHVAYLFLVFILYGLASALLAYVASILSESQSSTFGAATGVQGFGTLIYFIVYSLVMNYAAVSKVDSVILICHFVISAFAPIGSVMRALFVALNLNSTSCNGSQLAANPASITLYGGPILYLILQSLLFFGFLLWHDTGAGAKFAQQLTEKPVDTSAADSSVSEDKDLADEVEKITSSSPSDSDGLRIVHLTKSFGKGPRVVDDVTFRVRHDEIFALLGPNGAGKSVLISTVRGDVLPSRNNSGGDVFVEGHSVTKQLAQARTHLGVCPQVDALDLMTVEEHLAFYARIKGVTDIDRRVRAMLRAVGLEALASRNAHSLSGGGKRKLSLGIALMGNPSVVLLDEPSCGLDVAAKRGMWRTLRSVAPGRAILMTTHSMEEADALATRVGIMAKRMLALGTTESLRGRFDTLQVHIVSRTAPRSSEEEMRRLREWILERYAGAEVEEKNYHGQTRFSVPAAAVGAAEGVSAAAGRVVVDLERNKEVLGIEHFSVSRTTLDQVFLQIVGRERMQEDEDGAVGRDRKEKKKRKGGWKFGS
ncbi:P-loop containing nucleoside triphosphate hydrolase protein [Coniochaeta sp. PMI_546]|nr:P-loop containing nucleoside triphosphate hydrolase protein [Coniochaeta sp. PMI_546]